MNINNFTNDDIQVLLSIQPVWVEKIASGEKTIEVRKTIPKIDKPFKSYIYMTKNNSKIALSKDNYTKEMMIAKSLVGSCGKVIGEFICDTIKTYKCCSESFNILSQSGSCLTFNDIMKYCNGKDLYAWHISNLKIYDKPKELSEFIVPCSPKLCLTGCDYVHLDNHFNCINKNNRRLKRPPQSWCYVFNR